MARDTMAFVFGASSGLTQSRHFKGIALGEPGEPDPQTGEQLSELSEPWVSHDKLGGLRLEDATKSRHWTSNA